MTDLALKVITFVCVVFLLTSVGLAILTIAAALHEINELEKEEDEQDG